MKRIVGRNIYVVDLGSILSREGPASFAQTAQRAKLSAIWIRIARGEGVDRNMTEIDLSEVKKALAARGVELWGWHVPFCKTRDAAAREAELISHLALRHGLDGLVLDAERTPESPRFQGGVEEAEIYVRSVRATAADYGLGLALSSHDRPSLHDTLPFEMFLKHVHDNCPQVYYKSADIYPRIGKSIDDYKSFEAARNFTDRYKPSGNITITGDVRLPGLAACLEATRNFVAFVKQQGFGGYSFWCWDTAPREIFDLFETLDA